MNTDTHDDSRALAVGYAQSGADSWRSVVHAQGSATPDHSDWYAITGEMVGTLRCLVSLTSVLADQVSAYGNGRVLRDDTGADPADRLDDIAVRAEGLRYWLDEAERAADLMWSQISHIAVEDPS